MISSGTGAIATVDGTAVTLIDNAGGELIREITIVNEGTIAGFFSIDGGTTWARIPAGPSAISMDFREGRIRPASVLVKRDGATNMSALYGYAY